jgi:hypothetical protein
LNKKSAQPGAGAREMGKSSKKKHGAREFHYNPYGKSTTRITDLCDLLSSATASTISAQPLMEDEAVEDDKSGSKTAQDELNEGEPETEKQVTRGSILQRHKREWKALRSQLEDLKAHKRAMGSATLEKKIAKKDVAKEIKMQTNALTDRHKKELEEFDEAQKNSMNV